MRRWTLVAATATLVGLGCEANPNPPAAGGGRPADLVATTRPAPPRVIVGPIDVGLGDERQAGVGVGVDGHRLDAEAAAGGEDAPGDLAAVGDQDSLDHVRNTPNRSVPTIGWFAITDRQMASTVRVSRGSMTPSS